MMALAPNFREEYIELLEGCLILVKKRNDFLAVLEKIEKLTAHIQEGLDKIDSPLSVERLLDPDNGRIKAPVETLLKPYTELWNKVEALSALERERRYYISFGWTDAQSAHVDVALAISMYSSVEKEIVSAFGEVEGNNIILEAKKVALALEDELNITFFAPEVKRMKVRAALRELFTDYYPYVVYGKSAVYEEDYRVNFANAKGQAFRFEKAAELHFEGNVYVELEFMEDYFAAQSFAYYLVEPYGKEGARLTRVDDPDLNQKLEKYREDFDLK